MVVKDSTSDSVANPRYARAKPASKYFQIGVSTLWQWSKTRDGFPKPFKAGARVTLFDLNAIEAYLKSGANK